ncbi:hypothetical protein NEDG_02246, partial [Nematocida displodere]
VELQSPTFPPMGNNRATTKYFMLTISNVDHLAVRANVLLIFEWISRHFRGMKGLSIGFGFNIRALTQLIDTHRFVMTTNPTLTEISIGAVNCLPPINPKETVLSFSLDAWELCTKGALSAKLAETDTDLAQLSAGEQEVIVFQRWIEEESEFSCSICCCTLAELRETKPNTDICILDHPGHRVCGSCLNSLAGAGQRPFGCPTCRGLIAAPVLKNRIYQNSQGSFVLEMAARPAQPPIISFPSPNIEELLVQYQ